MCRITEVLKYVYKNYPLESRKELSLDRLIKVLFLIDWKAAIKSEENVTRTRWNIINSEPKMDNNSLKRVIDFIERMPQIVPFNLFQKLDASQREVIDFVIETVSTKDDRELTLLVNSTFPVVTQDEADIIDLSRLAITYNRELKPMLEQEKVGSLIVHKH